MRSTILLGVTSLMLIASVTNAADFSDSAGASAAPGANPNTPQKIDVNALKQRYWKGNSPDLGVVQNRTFTKAGRLHLDAFGSSISHDPFLTTYSVGFALGTYLSEYVGIRLMYWKNFESPSAAVPALIASQTAAGTAIYNANVNQTSGMIGGEIAWSVLYGKLSLLGKGILHFDVFVSGGGGLLSTQSGNIFAPWAGIGEHMYLNNYLALTATFRTLFYSENLYEQNNVPTRGNLITNRFTVAPAVTLGISAFVFSLF